MSQATFETENRSAWNRMREHLDALDFGGGHKQAPEEFPALYRKICQHLALARHRRYGAKVIDDLNTLAMRGYQHLHGNRVRTSLNLAHGLAVFGRAVRDDWPMLLLSSVLFLGPALIAYLVVTFSPDSVYSLLSPTTVDRMEQMYDPKSARFLRERDSGSDLLMFGFYIRNNIGISFRSFATGIFGGLGSAFFMILNGVLLGAVAAHLQHVGYGVPFYSFVIGHASFELTAIVLSGAAGLRLGWSVISPGRLTRGAALKTAAKRVGPIVFGMTVMLVFAAFIEAFWSSIVSLPASTKYTVGTTLWTLVFLTLGFAGKRFGH